ncbi:hypothetical protein SEA_KUWABARA_78 [Gordonia phage Kuwabara]|nr:hypothetical protein SEA_KUWABARA_78 [Gordonia phage Kuwabara]
MSGEREWPKTTPTGHVYTAPTTYAELCSRHTDAAQASVECWSAEECPPEPTWEMVGLAHREVDGLRSLLGNFVDDEPCRLDHHSGCQAHGFTELDGFECPVSAARRALGGSHV